VPYEVVERLKAAAAKKREQTPSVFVLPAPVEEK
jgi:hypothetical protein